MIPALQNFDTKNFIQHHWQKKPCLIKSALPDFKAPLSPEELAGLACELEVYSRLVLEKGGTSPWQLRYGPFEEDDFTSLPPTHYSLLVSECEKWIPEFAELLDAFRFIPGWRIDDVMLSYAPSGGSVGPHTDEYDVFLLQVSGQRRWLYTDQRPENPCLLPGLDLAILESFEADHDMILEPGDILYLPPGVAHHGVAVDDNCMTCSVGFRAPTAIETLESLVQEIDNHELGQQRYSDADLESNRHYCEITTVEIERFRRIACELLKQPQEIWANAVGKLLTDAVIDQPAMPEKIDQKALLETEWIVNPDSRLLYHQDDSNIRFYYNGKLCLLPCNQVALRFAQQLCDRIEIEAGFIEQYSQVSELLDLLILMANSHAIISVN